MTSAEKLIHDLHHAFDYTTDSNQYLIGDPAFSITEVAEELMVEHAYQFLCAYITRNKTMINSNMED